MRPMFVIGGLIGVLAVGGILAWARFAPAQGPSAVPGSSPAAAQTRTIQFETNVHAGPSDSFYVTNHLRPGDTVEVLGPTEKTNPGWVAIKPPPGSKSWIDSQFVANRGSGYGLVDMRGSTEAAPVQPAGMGTVEETPLDVVKLQSGTQVSILPSPPKTGANNRTWLPIQPPSAEVRYIPASAFSTSGVQPAAAASQSGFTPAPGLDTSGLTQANDLLNQAVPHLQRAAQSSDPAIANAARARLNALNVMMAQSPATPQPGYPTTVATVGGGPRVVLGSSNTAGQLTSTSNNTALYANSTAATGTAAWTKWGRLRKTSFTAKDGQAFYRIEDDRGTPLAYAVPAAGLTLEPYLGQMVCLYGVTSYQSGDNAMRNSYTIVSNLALPPNR
jgi:hypothetical protein